MRRFNLIQTENEAAVRIVPAILDFEDETGTKTLDSFSDLDEAVGYLDLYAACMEKETTLYLNNVAYKRHDTVDWHSVDHLQEDFIEVGSAFGDDQCQQAETAGYDKRLNKLECEAMVRALRRLFPDRPEGADLRICWTGSYYEVRIYFDESKFDAAEWTFNIDANLPETLPAADKRWLKDQLTK